MVLTVAQRAAGRACVSPAFARIKGLSARELDVVDFGVPGRGAQGAVEAPCSGPLRHAIKRSEIKIDGCRKRWNCDKNRCTESPRADAAREAIPKSRVRASSVGCGSASQHGAENQENGQKRQR